MKIAILFIGIGEYIYFWEKFYKSFSKKFIPESEKHFFVFSDSEKLSDYSNVTIIHQKNLGWPKNTLYRYKMFLKIEDKLKDFDYCFFFNANMICQKNISASEFLPQNEDLVAVKHPGYYNQKYSFKLPYERDKKSKAVIPYFSLLGQYYFMGGINGGKTNAFLKMCREIDKNIEIDEKNGIIAIWNDESHFNRYLATHKNYRMLNPSFGFPEDRKLPFEDKILILEKCKYIKLNSKKLDNKNKVKNILRLKLILLRIFEIYKKFVINFID